jgi:hypothetical protein
MTREAQPAWQRLIVQTMAPDEKTGNPGAVIVAEYAHAGTEVRVKYQGRIFTARCGAGDDVRAAARKLLRERHGKRGDFNSPIVYPRRGIV